jgi:NADH dehydrogenase
MWLENLMETSQESNSLDVVTGAFGFSGKYITGRLLKLGHRVRTLTNHVPQKYDPRVEVAPLDFSDLKALVSALRGVKVLYNSYWVRFSYRGLTHDVAVANSKKLISAAVEAGVERIVHVSITNPSLDSPLPYFRGKAEVEAAIRASKLSYAILRPAVLFGDEDILINNIAWMLRRLPLFAVPGQGDYGLQPIFVDDLAALAVEYGGRQENVLLDAVGPEIYRYDDLVLLIREVVGSHSRIVRLPPWLVGLASSLLNRLVDDVVLTQEEIRGLMANLLVPNDSHKFQPNVNATRPTGMTSLKKWLEGHATTVGTKYASELSRHYKRSAVTRSFPPQDRRGYEDSRQRCVGLNR